MSKPLLRGLSNLGVNLSLFSEEMKAAFNYRAPKKLLEIMNWKDVSDPTSMQIEFEPRPFFFGDYPMQQVSKDYVCMRRIAVQLRSGALIGHDCEIDETFLYYLARKNTSQKELFAVLEYYGSVKLSENGWITSANYFEVYLFKPEDYYPKLRRKIEDKLRKVTTKDLVITAALLGVKPN